MEILLASEIGHPRGVALTAIGPGPEACGTCGIGGGFKESMATGRAGNLHRRIGGDPPVVG